MSWADVGSVGGPVVALAAIVYAGLKDRAASNKDDQRQKTADALALQLQTESNASQVKLADQANTFQREMLELEKVKTREEAYYTRAADLAEELNAVIIELLEHVDAFVHGGIDHPEYRIVLLQRLDYVAKRSNLFLPRGSSRGLENFTMIAQGITSRRIAPTDAEGALAALRNEMAMLTVVAESVVKFGPEIEP